MIVLQIIGFVSLAAAMVAIFLMGVGIDGKIADLHRRVLMLESPNQPEQLRTFDEANASAKQPPMGRLPVIFGRPGETAVREKH